MGFREAIVDELMFKQRWQGSEGARIGLGGALQAEARTCGKALRWKQAEHEQGTAGFCEAGGQ